MTIALTDVTKMYGAHVTAVHRLNLEIQDGEFFTLLGPSGCGKTTTLRMIAGLEVPTSGTIRLDGEDVTALRPAKRDIAFVFQFFDLDDFRNVIVRARERSVFERSKHACSRHLFTRPDFHSKDRKCDVHRNCRDTCSPCSPASTSH